MEEKPLPDHLQLPKVLENFSFPDLCETYFGKRREWSDSAENLLLFIVALNLLKKDFYYWVDMLANNREALAAISKCFNEKIDPLTSTFVSSWEYSIDTALIELPLYAVIRYSAQYSDAK